MNFYIFSVLILFVKSDVLDDLRFEYFKNDAFMLRVFNHIVYLYYISQLESETDR